MRLIARTFVAIAVVVASTFASDAVAGWPPSPGDTLADPSSWPNDPDYSQLWSYVSYLPSRSSGAPALLDADRKLGAAGMSVDLAWESSTGSAAVKIAVLDSGILWEEADLLQQAWLNPAELTGAHLPLTAQGGPCGGAGVLAGYDCNGDGAFSVADYAEDPRMTPVVLGDKCVDPRSGAPKGDRLAGDVNHNCVLDAGDLIELFSDGVDDDGDGYTDDIAGWDFVKNDNNPYDDTRGGHGTAISLEAAAQGNNHVEGVGVCPGCRFIMLRVGDSSVVNSNDVAKALVYAADNAYSEREGPTTPLGAVAGANVAVLAVDAVNLTAFGRAAIDYAYSKNVVVVTSIGDDNSRHHTLPATFGHTLTVHGVGLSGATAGSSASFVDDVDCGNFGGQLAVSASGEGCSDEAAGRTAGMVGLIESVAIGMSPPLSAEEVIQIVKLTADVIDVPESRTASGAAAAGYYESLPGFSQRFGYGRVNAASAVRAVDAGQIPPEVEITSPAWFQTLYADRTLAPVPVYGRVAATRAPSYDLSIDWAPGVEPLDGDFVPLAATVTNIPGQTVSGGGTVPLALVDPGALDTAHAADPDSPHHENDRTITLRVRAVAHYAAGDVGGEARRSIALVNEANGLDRDLLPGFPLQLSGSVEGGAKLADIDGDGVRDIVLGTNDGFLHVLSATGAVPREIRGFPYALQPLDGFNPASPNPAVPSYLTALAYERGANGGIATSMAVESIDGTPAIGDLGGDGKLEIVFASWEGTLYVVDSNGKNVAGWPQRLPLVPSCPDDPDVPGPAGDCMDVKHALARGAFASPVLADFDGDGTLEIVLAAFDGNVYVFHDDGTPLAGFPVRVHSPNAFRFDRIMSTPAVTDFTGDGVPDILVGTNETVGQNGSSGYYFLVDGHGSNGAGGPYLPDWPVPVATMFGGPVTGLGTSASPIAVAFDGTTTPEALLQGNGALPLVVQADPGPQSATASPPSYLPAASGFAPLNQFGDLSNATPDSMLPLFSHPSVGDLDQDGTPDVIMSGGSQGLEQNLKATTGAIPFQHLLAMWSGATGQMMRGSPVVLEDYTRMSSQAIADVTGDGYPEVIVGTGGYFVHAVDACGREPSGWPKFTDGWVMGTPAVGDVNGDHMLEVVAATRDGYLYAWTTAGTQTAVIEWESFHHDNANTGSYGTPLDQGPTAPGAATTPLVCDAPTGDAGATRTPAKPPTSSGCRCSIGMTSGPIGSRSLVGLAVAALAVARRRGTDRRGRRRMSKPQ